MTCTYFNVSIPGSIMADFFSEWYTIIDIPGIHPFQIMKCGCDWDFVIINCNEIFVVDTLILYKVSIYHLELSFGCKYKMIYYKHI